MKLAEKIVDKFSVIHYAQCEGEKDCECVLEEINAVQSLLDEQYNKPIEECLVIVDAIQHIVETVTKRDSSSTFQQLKSLLETMKGKGV